MTRVVAFVVVLAIAAPAGASSPSSSRAAGSACSLLKTADVEKATGEDVVKGTKAPAPRSARVCDYDVADAPERSVHVWVQTGKDAKTGFTLSKQLFEDQIESVSGFGKRAFHVGSPFNTLYVMKGTTLVYVQYVVPDSGAPTDVKRAVAAMTKIVLRRL